MIELIFSIGLTVRGFKAVPGLRSIGAFVFLLPNFSRKVCTLLGNFFKVHGCALSILQPALKFHKNFPCMLSEFFMFYKKLACMFPCSM